VATYEAGRHWENRNLLAKEKATSERGSGTGSQNTTPKGTNKGSREQGKGKGKKNSSGTKTKQQKPKKGNYGED